MVDAYIAHREERERQIVSAVAAGAGSIAEVVDVVYAGLDAALVPAAIHQVEVQIRKLAAEGRVASRRTSGGGVEVLMVPGGHS